MVKFRKKGHRDNKNKSGLGSYHYHCGGNPAHLHTGGVCPYKNSSSSTQQSSKNQNSSNTQSVSESKNQATISPEIPANINLVFDSVYYSDNNNDLKQLYGTDYTSLLNHFLSNGMKEGRVGCSAFNVQVYKDSNADLEEAYGDDLPSYYAHYMERGYSENRVAN